ncbi:MAG: 6,7-dimethyl-8-ribityllumazine synthase [Mailhella sp.]|nr:6,7-dimethyl-8-ribityllumazine synthase [Mailhella sp.]
MYAVKTIEGQLNAQGLKVAIVASRFNDFVVGRLVDGAIDYLVRHGASADDITVIKVPGAFELPVVCKKIAGQGIYSGIIALGAVIRGSTPHFDVVCAEASKGIAQVSLQALMPIGFGLLTTDNLEQAIERAGAHAGNKGAEAAAAMLETVRVMEQVQHG